MGTMGTDARTPSRILLTVLALLALLSANLLGIGAPAASASDSPSAWTIVRAILVLSDGDVVDSETEPEAFIHKAGSDFYLWREGNADAEVHLSCSETLAGASLLDREGESTVTIEDYYIDMRNPQGHPAGCPIGNPDLLDEDPELSVAVTKANDADDDGTFSDEETAAAAGDAVPFEVTITNTGDVDAEVTTFTDTWPAGAAEPDGTLNLLTEGEVSCGDGEDGSFDLASDALAPDQTITCTFTVDDYAPAAGESLTNRVDVTIEATQYEDLSAGGHATSTVDVDADETPAVEEDPEPAIELVKTVTDGVQHDEENGAPYVDLSNGATHDIEYTYAITNVGEEDLENLTLFDDQLDWHTDALDDVLEGGKLAVDETVEVTATHTGVGLDDFDDGLLVNLATVTGEGVETGTEVEDSDSATVYDVEVLAETETAVVEEAEPEVEVLAEVLSQEDTEVAADADTLPRTGLETTTLALLGLLFTVLGAVALLLAPQGRSRPGAAL